MLKLINRIPLLPLVFGALLLGFAPLSGPSHLVEKVSMLTSGNLSLPVDMFDLCMHAILPVLLVVKLIQKGRPKSADDSQ